MVIAIVLGCLAWAVCGPSALMLDHVRKFDLTVGDAVFCTLMGVAIGPFAWVMWWMDGKDLGAGRVLCKKRQGNRRA